MTAQPDARALWEVIRDICKQHNLGSVHDIRVRPNKNPAGWATALWDDISAAIHAAHQAGREAGIGEAEVIVEVAERKVSAHAAAVRAQSSDQWHPGAQAEVLATFAHIGHELLDVLAALRALRRPGA